MLMEIDQMKQTYEQQLLSCFQSSTLRGNSVQCSTKIALLEDLDSTVNFRNLQWNINSKNPTFETSRKTARLVYALILGQVRYMVCSMWLLKTGLLAGQHAGISFTWSKNGFLALQGWHVALINVHFGIGSRLFVYPCQSSRLLLQKCVNIALKTVRIWNFAHKFSTQFLRNLSICMHQ